MASKWLGDAITLRVNATDFKVGEPKLSNVNILKEDSQVIKDTDVVFSKEKVESVEIKVVKKEDKKVDDEEEEQEEEEESNAAISSPHQTHNISSLTISDTVTQQVHVCVDHKKPRLLIKFIERVREKEKDEKERQPGAMIIFCNKIKSVKIVYDFLTRQKIKGVEMLHGKMKQDNRENALNNFKAGKLNILCATDVAARGIYIFNDIIIH